MYHFFVVKALKILSFQPFEINSTLLLSIVVLMHHSVKTMAPCS